MAKIVNLDNNPLIPSIFDTKHKGREYILRITLEDTKPLIYRKLSVPSNIRLCHLAAVILRSMGWVGYHLDEFVQDKTTFYESKEEIEQRGDDDFGPNIKCIDWATVTLSDVLKKKGDTITYIYDLGDHWEHKVKLMEIHRYPQDSDPDPYIIEGKHACPPDDVGGTSGFERMKEVMANPGSNFEEYMMFKDWLPKGYDMEAFNQHDAQIRIYDYMRAVLTFQHLLEKNRI